MRKLSAGVISSAANSSADGGVTGEMLRYWRVKAFTCMEEYGSLPWRPLPIESLALEGEAYARELCYMYITSRYMNVLLQTHVHICV